MNHRYKQKPEEPRRYNPAAAVRKMGDKWTFTDEVWSVSTDTSIALRDATEDSGEAALMRLMEEGRFPRYNCTE